MGNKWKKILRASAIATGGAVVVAGYYAYQKLDQSLSSLIVSRYLKRMDYKEKTNKLVNEVTDETTMKFTLENRKAVTNPFATIFKKHQEYIINGMQVFVWNDTDEDDQDVLIYFHGGGYVFQPTDFHFWALNWLARQANAKVIMPIYPKTPEYNYQDVFPRLESIYLEILEKYSTKSVIHLMGDSAGGGLALAFAYYLHDQEIKQPDHLILISPWLDLTNSHPDIEEYYEHEVFYGMDAMNEVALMWAGGQQNLTNKYVSPKFGNPNVLTGKVTLFTGNYETFYGDIIDLAHSLEDKGIDYTLEIGDKQHHVYPLYPTFEGIQARKKIANEMISIKKV